MVSVHILLISIVLLRSLPLRWMVNTMISKIISNRMKIKKPIFQDLEYRY